MFKAKFETCFKSWKYISTLEPKSGQHVIKIEKGNKKKKKTSGKGYKDKMKNWGFSLRLKIG